MTLCFLKSLLDMTIGELFFISNKLYLPANVCLLSTYFDLRVGYEGLETK